MQIAKVIQMIKEALPAGDARDTVDTLIAGDPDQPVTAIVVTFLATCDVLEAAVSRGANLVITHEPTFYNHRDETGWLAEDPVFRAKKELIDRNRLVVCRQHDGMHRHRPDLILQGMVRKLGWRMPPDPRRPNLCEVDTLTLQELALHCRNRLGIGPVRIAGNPEMNCSKIGLLPGACGGRRQIEILMQAGADVVICGESPEWETCEYVRDAARASLARGLLVLGHANSEEAGMEALAAWLRPLLPACLPIHYLPAGDPFQSI